LLWEDSHTIGLGAYKQILPRLTKHGTDSNQSFGNQKHYEISDGQLQKVLVARALAQDTPLIIWRDPLPIWIYYIK
jgi:ABC-type cobalamin/Fe3+-siderophores transport system ATPase subunit